MTTPAPEEKSFYTPEELAALQQQFEYMLCGQPFAFVLADPGATSRRIVLVALQQAGYEEIIETKTGKEALAVAAAQQEQGRRVITIADENLPAEMDLLSYLRKFYAAVPTGLAFVTGSKLSPEKQTEVMKLGAKAIFPRPLKPESLLAKIEELGIKLSRLS